MNQNRGETTTAQQTHYDRSTTPTTAIIEAIADVETTDPITLSRTLETTLYDHVDPDALDRIVAVDSDVAVSFTVDEYAVRIDGGTVYVRTD